MTDKACCMFNTSTYTDLPYTAQSYMEGYTSFSYLTEEELEVTCKRGSEFCENRSSSAVFGFDAGENRQLLHLPIYLRVLVVDEEDSVCFAAPSSCWLQ